MRNSPRLVCRHHHEKQTHRFGRALLAVIGLVLTTSSLRSQPTPPNLTISYVNQPGPFSAIFFNRQNQGSNLVGTLQIVNSTGTWAYFEQDFSQSSGVAVTLPSTVYLLGPSGTVTIPNVIFGAGSYLKLNVTTPLGLDFTKPSDKNTALMGALTTDLLCSGLFSFSVPPDSFNNLSNSLDSFNQFLATFNPLPEFWTALQNGDPVGALTGLKDTVGANPAAQKAMQAKLASLIQNFVKGQSGTVINVTSDQVGNALEDTFSVIDFPTKAELITELTGGTYSAPTSAWIELTAAANTTAPAPVLLSISPTTLQTKPLSTTQSLTITGTGFTPSTQLVFSVGNSTYASRPDRLQFINANTLTYNIVVGGAAGSWTVFLADGIGTSNFSVIADANSLYTITPRAGPNGSILPGSALAKAGGESQAFTAISNQGFMVDSWYVDSAVIPLATNSFTLPYITGSHSVYVTFKPTTTVAVAQGGSLTVNLLPAGAVSAGAQWQVDGGAYHNNGDIIMGLTAGSHTISCKPVPGFTSHPAHSVFIPVGNLVSDAESYTAILPATYTLTLNFDSSQGVASAWPSASGGIYTAGSVVQLSATTVFNHRFTGWIGDASGTANATTVVMNGNKTVTANFAAGDPNLGTITVTIQPAAAAAAGVKWGFNANDFRASGSSYTTFPSTYILTLHPVDGWLGPPSVVGTITAGQTNNVTVTFTQDTTPGLLTVTLSPANAAAAGAKWHVNGGAAQGDGATVSLAPGSYTVTFDPVSGWTAPPSQTVQVVRAQTTVATASYTPPVGQPQITAIYPGFGSLAGGTTLTVEGINFGAPATVSIGGNPATNVNVMSPSQLTCQIPSSTVYGTQPVVVQTPGVTVGVKYRQAG